jgi:hypothetical protein
MLLSQKANQQPSGAFVGSSDEVVDAAMLSGQSTVRMVLAACATALVDDTLEMLLGHGTGPP